MDRLETIGRIFFAVSLAGFGVQELRYAGFLTGVQFVPEWIPGHVFWAYLTGALLIVAGASIAFRKGAKASAALVGTLLFLIVLVLHGPRIAGIIQDGTERTRAFETLALCATAFVLARVMPSEQTDLDRFLEKAAGLARLFLAISLVVFGLDHFQYARFVAAVIPVWVPWHWFWAYFTGLCFIAAGVSIAIGKFLRPAGSLLGLMFFLWVALLHTPRVVGKLHDGAEWNSWLVALAMSGAGFIIAASAKPGASPIPAAETPFVAVPIQATREGH